MFRNFRAICQSNCISIERNNKKWGLYFSCLFKKFYDNYIFHCMLQKFWFVMSRENWYFTRDSLRSTVLEVIKCDQGHYSSFAPLRYSRTIYELFKNKGNPQWTPGNRKLLDLVWSLDVCICKTITKNPNKENKCKIMKHMNLDFRY